MNAIFEILTMGIRAMMQEKIEKIAALGFENTFTYEALVECRDMIDKELEKERAQQDSNHLAGQ